MIAYKVAVYQARKYRLSKIDNYMVCLSFEDAQIWKEDFNFRNKINKNNWYLVAKGDPIQIEIKIRQFNKLKKHSRAWESTLNKL